MILLDEDIPEDLLRKWRIRIRQIGQDVGRRGMKDEEHVLPLLHELDRPTLFTAISAFSIRTGVTPATVWFAST